ncbi:MAG: head maturation protease, ClpP-related [Cypionkella sp.]
MKTGADLILNGEIILTGDVLTDDEAGWYGDQEAWFSPRVVREALSQMRGAVTVRLTSGGGIAYAGEAIRSILAGYPGGVTMIVEGLAASAASLIFMGGTERIMSEGALLMIHDPSNLIWGTEEEMRKGADVLGKMADTYAAVYARAAGMTTEEARAIMVAETWLSAEDAVTQGFATSILQAESAPIPAMTMEAGKAAFMSAVTQIKTRMGKNSSQAAMPRPPAAVSGSPAMMAISEEAGMPNETPAALAAVQVPAAPVTMALQPVTAEAAVLAERSRRRGIMAIGTPFLKSGMLVEADIEALIEDGTTVEAAGQRFMAKMAEAQPPIGGRQPATITRDESETKIEGMIGALMGKADGPAADYRGLRVKSLAMHLAGPKRGFDDAGAIRAGMVSTALMSGGAIGVSDFSYITTSVMNRTLRAEYERRAATWQAVSQAPINAADFRNIAMVRFGGDFQLKKVLENGEYQNATLNDEADTFKVERRGRTINLTFEAIINDDMGAFARIPTEFALAARMMENSMVWALIRANTATPSDGVALFHASHNNLQGTGAVISAATVGYGRKKMWEQRALGTKDTDDFIQISPNRLIVPPALELAALQFTALTVPALDSSTNPFKSTLEVSVVPNIGAQVANGSDTAWYLISSDYPPVSVAYLDGYAAPSITTAEGMNPDVVTMNARHIFGAANTEWCGAFKNVGA